MDSDKLNQLLGPRDPTAFHVTDAELIRFALGQMVPDEAQCFWAYLEADPIAMQEFKTLRAELELESVETSLQTKASTATPNNLPIAIDRFVGRVAELDEVEVLMEQTRVLSLVGASGCGKSRLMRESGSRQMDRFPDGIHLVSLSDCVDPNLIPSVIGSVLGLRESSGREMSSVVRDYVQSRRMLILLDDCQDIGQECAKFIDDTLQDASHLSFIATSREPLFSVGAMTYAVKPLALPSSGQVSYAADLESFDATALFIERIRETGGPVDLELIDLNEVVEICTRLQGIPLALELAASRVSQLGLATLSRQLIEFVAVASGSSPSLSRTLDETLAWTSSHLANDEALVLRKLFVFEGNFDFSAAQAVCGELDGQLSSLVEFALLQREGDSDYPRYRMLDAVRSFSGRLAQEHNEQGQVLELHARHFASLVHNLDDAIRPSVSEHSLSAFLQDQENFRRALQTLLEGSDSESAGQLVSDLEPYWRHFGELTEGLMWFERAAELQIESPSLLAKLWSGRGVLSYQLGRVRAARDFYQRALTAFREIGLDRGTANVLSNLGLVNWQEMKLDEARSCYAEALELHMHIDDPTGKGNVLNNLGILEWRSGNLQAARGWLEQALVVRENAGNRAAVASTYINISLILADEGDFDRSAEVLQVALEITIALGSRTDTGTCLHNLGDIAWRQGRLEDASRYADASEAVYEEINDEEGLAFVSLLRGHVAADRGDHEEAINQSRRALEWAADNGVEHLLVESLEAMLPQLLLAGRPILAGRTAGALARTSNHGKVDGVAERFGLDLDDPVVSKAIKEGFQDDVQSLVFLLESW